MDRLKNSKGFSIIEALLILVIVGVVGFTGWFVWQSKQSAEQSLMSNNSSSPIYTKSTIKKTVSTPTLDANDAAVNYLTVAEWGLRFKIPSGLTDVQYKIIDNIVGGDSDLVIYAKPSGVDVQYRSEYTALDESGYPRYGVGQLYRSSDSTKVRFDRQTRSGKKIGNYFYYTEWAFNSLATGAGCSGLFGDSDSACLSENTAFQLVNQGDNALLNTIEPAQ